MLLNAESEALAARKDEARLNNFIAENKSFILAQASKTTHRYITESDDAWSIALSAFHEAVEGYSITKGPFKPFAALVIRRRVIDYESAQLRHTHDDIDEVSEASLATDDPTENPTRDEIEALEKVLQGYGVLFMDLTNCSPKAEKTRQSCARVVATLLQDETLLERMRQGKALPMKALEEASGQKQKIIERHRKYIIAATEILAGDYPILADYLTYIRKVVDEE